MIRSYMAVAGATAAACAIASAINCGGTTSNASAGSGGGGSSSTSTASTTATGASGGAGGSTSSAPFKPVNPPPPPSTMMPGDGTNGVTFAISKLYLGDTDPDGSPDQTNGWEHYGYNIDGVNPNDLSNFCKPVDGAAPGMVHQEGMNGIENAFGHIILQILIGLAPDASTTINDDIAAGKFTIMVQMDKLGTGSSYDPIGARLFLGTQLPSGTPNFTGTGTLTDWPVSPELLNDGMTIAGGSKVTFPMSYVTNDTWVSGTKGMVTLGLSVSGYTIDLDIANAVITMDMDTAHQKAAHGIISGVIPTSQLTEQIKMVAGSFDSGLCSGGTIDAILSQIAQASDIMQDGTQDPTKTCDGISIGIGFDAAIVQNPDTVGPPPTMMPNPCADAG